MSTTLDTLESIYQINQDTPAVPTQKLAGISTTFILAQQNQKLNLQVQQAIQNAAPAGTPLQVTGVVATESPFKTNGLVQSNVGVTFNANPSDENFAYVQIWFTGYNGSSTPQLMSQGSVSPVDFLCSTTGETVKVTVVAIGQDGTSADFNFAPITTVLLDGVTSAPSAPSIAQSLVSTPTGYQFSFNQLAGLSADLIDGYQIYRNTTNNSSTAAHLTYIKHNPRNSAAVVVSDAASNVQVFFYWVSSVNTTGLESSKTAAQSGTVTSGGTYGNDGNPHDYTGKNLVFNGDLSIYSQPTGLLEPLASSTRSNDPDITGAQQQTPNGWTRNFESGGNGEGVVYRGPVTTGFPTSGTYFLVMQDRQSSVNDIYASVTDAFPVIPSKQYRVSATVWPGLGSSFPTHAAWYFRVVFYQSGTTDFSRLSSTLSVNTPVGIGGSGGFTGGYDVVSGSTASGLQFPAATITAPADAYFARIALYHWNDGTAVASAWNLVAGDVRCYEVSGEGISTMLNSQGSLQPNQSVNFTKAAETTSTLGFSWGTQTFTRIDSSTFTLNSGSQSFTGLATHTTYFFYPYLTGFMSGTATMNFLGPFTAADKTQQQNANQDSRIGMGPLSDTTTASGVGGGGSQDNGGSCPHENEPVYVMVNGVEATLAAKDVRDGMLIRGYSFAEQRDIYRKVVAVRHQPSTMWYRIQGRLVSPCEQVWINGQWFLGYQVPGAERVRGVPADRIEIRVQADEHDERNYYLAGEVPLLIHNFVVEFS